MNSIEQQFLNVPDQKIGTIAHEKKRLSILDLDSVSARAFFLKEESYCSLDLPPYFHFDVLIDDVHKLLEGRRLSGLSVSPREHDDVNYTILNNKDGKYAWRPFQLIHPALYVSLVHHVTDEAAWRSVCDRFRSFSANPYITCLSLPAVSLTDEKDKAEQVNHWWQAVEQRSIELSLDYQYLIETDITDCYGAIYTHSIAWALHTKQTAKSNRKEKGLLGNKIDSHIQDMRHGQTNGIPQGSVLMDFIAEMVLGMADLELSDKIKNADLSDYRILRYRDDYRIFVNNPQDGERIVKYLTEVTIDLGLKLNPSKTKASSDVIRASIKADKLAWISRKHVDRNLQKHLFIIHDHAYKFPNSGSLVAAMTDFYKRLLHPKKPDKAMPLPLIAIVSDIAYHNPRAYAICAAVISKLMSFLSSSEEKRVVAEKINNRFAQIPNTGYMQIWIQRVTYPIAEDIKYEEALCKIVLEEHATIWNCDWISDARLKNLIAQAKIIDRDKLSAMDSVIPMSEVELFLDRSSEGYSA